ncbi:MAG: SdrD B-like domain-containing protein [Anaerolineales bacterium]|jgi:hypothetical protein
MNMRKLLYLAGLLFTLILGSACTPKAGVSIGDYTWLDSNSNGIQDKGEGPLVDVRVDLYPSGGTSPEMTTRSDKDGIYQFEGVAAGEYKLKFEPPTGHSFTVKDQFEDDQVDSDVNPAGNNAGWTDEFSVGSADDLTLDAGFTQGAPAQATPTPAILIPQPTPMTITPTPAVISGEHDVDLVCTEDKAGHFQYVKLPESSTVMIERTGSEIAITFSSPDGTTTVITLSGPVDEHGNFDLHGTGMVAGRPDISGTFIGTMSVESDGSVHLTGELTLGANGDLPQGLPIKFSVSS